MIISTINGFDDFCNEIKKIGFCLSGNNGEEVFSLKSYYSDNIELHTGSKEFDPWEWKNRAVKETDYICYGKVFLNKAGWITIDWIPDFISVRRDGKSFEELYHDGLMTQMEKQVFNLINSRVKVSINDIYLELGRSKKKSIVKALTNLQMLLLITICDEIYKISNSGVPYGWPVTVFSTMEEKFGKGVTEKAKEIDSGIAYYNISEQLKKLNSQVTDKKINKFIKKL
ncbi:MAG: hypothetical protein JEZ08_20690 [Clostridiales bacterium]|nr:hypothetical protein [Clostridiales bacterium]